MSAVLEGHAAAAALPLLARAAPERVFAWSRGRAVTAGEFLADVHAAAASAAQLVAVGRIGVEAALPGIALAFAANSAMKLGMAYATGGRGYLLRLAPGVACMVLAFALAVWLSR